MATGCSGLVDDGGNGGLTPDQITARRLWLTKALPVLHGNCAMCHVDGGTGATPAPTFIAGASDLDIRDTLLGHEPPEINLDAPATSHLLTRGSHDGPALDGSQSSDLVEWIRAEKAAGSSTGEPTAVIQTAKFPPAICTAGLPDDPAAPNPSCLVNKIALDTVGGVGAQIEFVLQPLSPGSYMTNMKLVPGTGGVYMEHPLFVSWPAGSVDGRDDCAPDPNGDNFCSDTLDRFASTVMNLMPGALPAEQQIASGTSTFPAFLSTDMMSIQFKIVSAYKP